MASNSLPNHSPLDHNSNAVLTPAEAALTPAILRRNGATRATRRGTRLTAENANIAEFAAATGDFAPLRLSSLVTAALVGIGLAAVEAVRLALVYEALGGFFIEGGALPFAVVLTFGLGALDGGLLLRMFAPAIEWRGMAIWAATGAWLLATTANSILVMYAIGGMMDASHQLANVAPAAVAIVLLLLRVLLVGALAWDRRGVINL